MNHTVRATLMGLGIPDNLIHVEHFGSDPTEVRSSVEPVADAQLVVHLDGQTIQEQIPKGKTILHMLKENAYDPPYSCESGVCGTCKARVLAGSVHMKAHMALDATAIAQGEVLTCQAIPTSPRVTISFDT